MATKDVRIQLKGDTRENWTTHNPILLENEIGIENDDNGIKLKIGNGSTSWNDLDYPLGYVTKTGGFAAGKNASTNFRSVAVGWDATANLLGTAIGASASAEQGVAIGASSEVENGFSGGVNARSKETGVAIGNTAITANGCTIGTASSNNGIAIGNGALAYNGISIGNNASTGVYAVEDGSLVDIVDAIQLGEGTNTTRNTFQVYNYPLLDENGKIYSDRLPETSGGSSGGVVDEFIIFVWASDTDNTYVVDGTNCVYIYLNSSSIGWCSSTWKDEYTDSTKYNLFISFPNLGDPRFGDFEDIHFDMDYSTWAYYKRAYDKDKAFGAIINGTQTLAVSYETTQQDYWSENYFERMFLVRVEAI